MRDIKEIEYWISKLEREESSFSNYAKLADLYAIRDRMVSYERPEPPAAAYSEASAPSGEALGRYGESDFLRTIAGKDPSDVWMVMDEHMDTLRVVNHRVYDSVMRKLSGL